MVPINARVRITEKRILDYIQENGGFVSYRKQTLLHTSSYIALRFSVSKKFARKIAIIIQENDGERKTN